MRYYHNVSDLDSLPYTFVAYLAEARSVIVEGEDLMLGAVSALIDTDHAVFVLVDVVTKVELK